MTSAPKASAKARPIARLRLAKVPAHAANAPECPPVFHVFEELYARTLRDMQARSCAAAGIQHTTEALVAKRYVRGRTSPAAQYGLLAPGDS